MKTRKFFSFVLVFILVVQLLPVQAIGEFIEDIQKSTDANLEEYLYSEHIINEFTPSPYASLVENKANFNYLELDDGERKYIRDTFSITDEKMMEYEVYGIGLKGTLDCLYIEQWTGLESDQVSRAYFFHENPEVFVDEYLKLSKSLELEIIDETQYEELLELMIDGMNLEAAAAELGIVMMAAAAATVTTNDIVAPFWLDTDTYENISLNTGSLRYEYPLVSLPGKNGLDIQLTIIYDSSDAELYKKSYRYESTGGWYQYSYNIAYAAYAFGGTLYIGVSTPETITFPQGTTKAAAESARLTALSVNKTEMVQGYGLCILKPQADEITSTYISGPSQYVDAVETGVNDILGVGWSWNLPNMKIPTSSSSGYLKLNGKIIELSYNTSGAYFKDYNVKDIRLIKSGTVYKLLYKNGDIDNFNASGYITSRVDRYGNQITYTYTTTSGKTRLTKITDSLNRVTTISYVDTGAMKITITTPDNKSTIINLDNYQVTSTYKVRSITSIKNAEDNSTQFNYIMQVANFAYLRDSYGANSYYLNLSSVTYPTGLITSYTFGSAYEKYGTEGYQTVFKVTSRKDIDVGNTYNKASFSYSGGYSNYPSTSSTLPVNYTYKTSVTDEKSITSVYTFNNKHLNTKIESYLGNTSTGTLLSNVQIEYDTTYKLPFSVNTKAFNSNGSFMETMVSYIYDVYGNITKYTDADGHITNYLYYTSGTTSTTTNLCLLTQKSYQQNASKTIRESYTLTTNNKSIAATAVYDNNVLVQKTEYIYDSYGNITNQKRYLDTTSYIETVYNYTDNQIRTAFNGAYLTKTTISGVLDADGAAAASSPGEAVKTVSTKAYYDVMGRVTKAIDERGYETTYLYDNLGNLTRLTHPDGTFISYIRNFTQNILTVTDELGNAVRYNYNGLGCETSIVDVASGVTLSSTIYDSYSRVVSTSVYNEYGFVRKIEYTYDWAGRVTEEKIRGIPDASNAFRTDYEGLVLLHLETYIYDDAAENGLYRKVTKTVYGDEYSPTQVTSTYTDKRGNAVKDSFMLNGIEYFNTYEYDYVGNLVKSLSAGDAAKGLAYTARCDRDYAGRVIREYNALGNYISTTYDMLGRKTSSTDYKESAVTYTYDVLGRLIKKETPFETGTNGKATIKYYYDPAGNIITEKAAKSLPGAALAFNQTDYEYSSRGFLMKVTSYKDGVTKYYTQYYYDATGNTLRMYTGLSAPLTITGLDAVTGADNVYSITKYVYNRFGNVTRIIDALNQSEIYTYDLLGNLLTKNDRNGNVIFYTYDALGRLLRNEVTTRDGTGDAYLAYTYTMTGAKRSEQSTTGDDEYSYTYDITTYFTYDSLGRIINESDLSEKVYTYDLNGNRTSLTISDVNGIFLETTYTYDNLNRLIGVSDNGVSVSYGYDLNGNRNFVEYDNGVREEYTYNAGNLVKSLVNKSPSGAVLSQFDYTYRLDGNQMTKTESIGRVTTYTYDDIGRLTSEDEKQFNIPIQNAVYTYDDAGNRATMVASGLETHTTVYTYDRNNRLLTEARTSGNSSVTSVYTYDANGNQLNKTSSDPLADNEAMQYNGFNQLMKVTVGDVSVRYLYYPTGLRYAKVTDDIYTTFTWDVSDLAEETIVTSDSGGSFNISRTVYIRGTSLAAAVTDGVLRYYLFNAHGDVVQLVNVSGAITKLYNYDAFGRERNIDDADTNNMRYCGEYYDSETKTVYLRARNYNPATGRFMSEDPIRSGLNWYTYCAGNPVYYIDPSGCVIIRDFVESRGGTASWNDSSKIATFSLNGKELTLTTKTGMVADGHFIMAEVDLIAYFYPNGNISTGTTGGGGSANGGGAGRVEQITPAITSIHDIKTVIMANVGTVDMADTLMLAGTIAVADGPLPYGDLIGLGIIAVAGTYIVCGIVYYAIDEAIRAAKNRFASDDNKHGTPDPTGKPNSTEDIKNDKGEVIGKRYYGPDGKAYKDEHYTDHGNPKQHPEVPHNHSWDWSDPKNPHMN